MGLKLDIASITSIAKFYSYLLSLMKTFFYSLAAKLDALALFVSVGKYMATSRTLGPYLIIVNG